MVEQLEEELVVEGVKERPGRNDAKIVRAPMRVKIVDTPVLP